VPAPVAAVTAAGRPRAGERAARGEKGVASALIAESGRARAVRDGTAVKPAVGRKGLGLGFARERCGMEWRSSPLSVEKG
jgi:hypothetical protein